MNDTELCPAGRRRASDSVAGVNSSNRLFPHRAGMVMSMNDYFQLETARKVARRRSSDGVRAGLARARLLGKRLGRPRVSPDIEASIRRLLTEGSGMIRVAREIGVGVSVVQRIKREMRSADIAVPLLPTPIVPLPGIHRSPGRASIAAVECGIGPGLIATVEVPCSAGVPLFDDLCRRVSASRRR